MPRRLILPAAVLAALAAIALLAPVLGLPNPVAIDVAHRLTGPGPAHWLGQDEYGRDVLSRLVWGARASLGVSVASTGIAMVFGTACGVLGGYLRGIAELLSVRAMDIVLCFPPLLLAMLAVTLLGPGAATLVMILSILYVPGFARVAYAGVLSARAHDYVEAVRVLGAGPGRIMLRTILPNIMGPVLVQVSLTAAAAIVLESGLSFLGLGVVPPTPSWGLMIRGARDTMAQAPLLLLWPCLALSATILAINALCDALRAGFHPHQARRGRRLVNAVLPGLLPPSGAGPVLAIEGLTVAIATPSGPIHPVRDLHLHVEAGETLALVGESGSGKSLTGLAALGLLPAGARAVTGRVTVGGQDVLRAGPATLRRMRGATAAMVFQDPLGSLNPVQRIGAQVAEAVRAHRPAAPGRAEAVALLQRVGIPEPTRRARAFPHEMSGGMRQRAMIAIAVANNPRLLIADEPTTALDVTVQAQVLDLLAGLRRDGGMAMVFITHSLPVVSEIADRVAVMYAGQIVEQGPKTAVFGHPLHPYTAALLASAPADDGAPPRAIPGIVPLPNALPPGCAFAPRCTLRLDACEAAPPALVRTGERETRCIRWQSL